MSATASPWNGLGSLNLRPRSMPKPALDDNEPDDFARESVKRVVPAAGAPSVLPDNPIVSPFSHPFPASTITEESSLPKETAAPAKPAAQNLRQRLAATIRHAERISRAGLAESLPDLTSNQITQTLFNLKTAKFVKSAHGVDGAVMFHLTPLGVKWIEGGKGRPSTHNPKVAAPRAKPVKRAKKTKAKPVVATRAKPGRKSSAAEFADFAASVNARTALVLRNFEPVIEPSFRCALFSDGAFHLAKNGNEIDLTPAEFRAAVRFLDRMGVEPELGT